MTIFKCKICGGTLEINQGESVAVCEYCGTKQTLPRLDDERRANLYDRANHFRRNNEYDRATGIYEQILNEDSTDSEAYWSLVLCRYGIEYVEDPASRKRLPTVNRMQFTSVFDDENYRLALQYADGEQRTVYEEEANAINELQKGILAISEKEEPFDVFICYKETDANGRRTQDAVLANDLYHQLTQEGFKVFFARITLEDKLGTAYEPYIFAALNSAKVMVVLGTKPEHFNAVWVRNEWSRYLALIKGGDKKTLIPAYRDMDPYDLPEEFSHLQAQDMSKLGFMQDLIRGIGKIIQADKPKAVVREATAPAGGGSTEGLLKRAYLYLEDGDWTNADQYCERVLDQDPENAMGYVGKLMAELHVHRQEELADCEQPFEENGNYRKAIRFADDKLANELKGYIAHIVERNENARLESIYTEALYLMNQADTQEDCEKAAEIFESIKAYKDSAELIVKCHEKKEICRIRAEKEAAEKGEWAQAKHRQDIKQKKIRAILFFSAYCAVILFFILVVFFSDNSIHLGDLSCYRYSSFNKSGTFIVYGYDIFWHGSMISLSDFAIAGIFVVLILIALIPLLYYIAQDLYWDEQYKKAYNLYRIAFCFKDSRWMACICYGMEMEREKRYTEALESLGKASTKVKKESLRVKCNDEIAGIEKIVGEMTESEKQRSQQIYLEKKKERKEKRKRVNLILFVIVAVVVVILCVWAKCESIYDRAKSLRDNFEYETAVEAFDSIKWYKDSKKLKWRSMQDIAGQLRYNGRYEEALVEYQKTYECMKVEHASDDDLDSIEEQINKAEGDIHYQEALLLMDVRQYEEALTVLNAIEISSLDVNAQIENCNIAIKYGDKCYNQIKNMLVGNKYTFGSYEQDGNESNGAERIQWWIQERAVSGNSIELQLKSVYCLDYQKYNLTLSDVYWENCSLRLWLNTDFKQAAFDADERAMIVKSEVTSGSASGAVIVKDDIFILGSGDGGAGGYTKYVKAKASAMGAYPNDESYWLRTSSSQHTTGLMTDFGRKNHPTSQNLYVTDFYGVCPMVRISIDLSRYQDGE